MLLDMHLRLCSNMNASCHVLEVYVMDRHVHVIGLIEELHVAQRN